MDKTPVFYAEHFDAIINLDLDMEDNSCVVQSHLMLKNAAAKLLVFSRIN